MLLTNNDFRKLQKLLDWQRKVAEPLEVVLAKPDQRRRARLVGGGGYQLLKVTPDVDLEPNTTGPCTVVGGIQDGRTIYVTFDWIDEEKISAGKEVIIGRFKDDEPLSPDPGNGQTKVYRPISAECEDPPPPDVAQIYTDNELDAVTGVFGPIPGAAIDYEFGQGYVSAPVQYGFQVTEPGYWELSFRFTFESSAPNMTVDIRANTNAGPLPALSFPIRQADATTSGAISTIATVTQAEIDVGAVFLVIERNISASGVWISSELDIKRMGYSVPT